MLDLRKQRIGIIGGGVVGQATARAFLEHVAEVIVHDVDVKRGSASLEAAVGCDFVFLCLPTPAKRGGQCDLTVLKYTIENIACRPGWFRENTVLLVKSTVPVGTTRQLASVLYESQLGRAPIVHCPEFLTARCAAIDAAMPARIVLGGVPGVPALYADLAEELHRERFPHVTVHRMFADESELVKLACNAFAGVKIGFFNELYEFVGKKFSISRWEAIRRAILAGGMISPAHTQVPGSDGLGFAGACLPKDLTNLMLCLEAADVEAGIMAAADRENTRRRS